MTNAELIAKIKAEIERLKGICTAQIKANPGQTFPFIMEMTGYDKLLSFLSTLESEKPMEGLEEEIKSWIPPIKVKVDEDVRGIMEHIREWGELIARHFAEWGYLRAAEKYNEIEYNRQRAEESAPNDLEEAAEEYCLATEMESPYERRLKSQAFKSGSRWKKEQMMKEAVEGYIAATNESSAVLALPRDGFKKGDKVRVIIVKENYPD